MSIKTQGRRKINEAQHNKHFWLQEINEIIKQYKHYTYRVKKYWVLGINKIKQ